MTDTIEGSGGMKNRTQKFLERTRDYVIHFSRENT